MEGAYGQTGAGRRRGDVHELRRSVCVERAAVRVVRCEASSGVLLFGGLVNLPPGARRTDAAEVRRPLPAGALGTVGDDPGREHVERDGVAADADRAYGDPVAEHVRQSRLTRWQEQRGL